MPYRSFVDSAGVTWEVWNVVPADVFVDRFVRERRTLADRRVSDAGPPHGVERRRLAERRGSGEDMRRGWLAFRSALQRRRFAPVPVGWELFDDARLERLCRLARPSSPRVPIVSPEPGAEPDRS